MPSRGADLEHIDWKKILWEKTPYDGVFVSLLDEEPDPEKPDVPKFTLMAVRVDPGKSIPLHRHNRESNWTETLTFSQGGHFEINGDHGLKQISVDSSSTFQIGAKEVLGLRNTDSKTLYFYSKMKPGFTGYQEIEEVK